jgi:hypothetical protein
MQGGLFSFPPFLLSLPPVIGMETLMPIDMHADLRP